VTLRVVGAGLGRTGTASLQLALQQLLDGRCYHMVETFGRPDDIPVWHAAVDGRPPADWNAFLSDFVATVDWPACAFWRELSAANPEAVVLLSTRSSADAWWKSANDTIFQVSKRAIPEDAEGADVLGAQMAMATDMLSKTFTPEWQDEEPAKRAYEAHNAAVRADTDPARLVDWQPGDGWEPLCAALEVPVPDEPFPHVNSTADFRAMIGLE
jgi:Sulfotransferase domain